MPKQLFKVISFVVLVTAPVFLMAAPPTFTPTLPDVTPIDQQTLMLASGGAVYAMYKLKGHFSRKK